VVSLFHSAQARLRASEPGLAHQVLQLLSRRVSGPPDFPRYGGLMGGLPESRSSAGVEWPASGVLIFSATGPEHGDLCLVANIVVFPLYSGRAGF
jgi:hypothetical protein